MRNEDTDNAWKSAKRGLNAINAVTSCPPESCPWFAVQQTFLGEPGSPQPFSRHRCGLGLRSFMVQFAQPLFSPYGYLHSWAMSSRTDHNLQVFLCDES